MSKYAIQVEGLGKEYIIGGAEQRHDSFREMLTGSLTAPFRKLRKLGGAAREEERFWALKDVSFNVKQGEVLGIIGRNGAGKSTLMKVLSRITSPSSGRVAIRGKVASLLEVGTGFHPELTGRENVFLNGAILGMTRQEVARNFDDIISFADLGQFVDTPVKRYSSGMYVRLAFSVAAHLDPDILLVDEVLAVGDAQFQKRSLGKMEEVSRAGRTVLFISHNLPSILSLCERVILLKDGAVYSDGEPPAIVHDYLSEATYSDSRELSYEADLDKPITIRSVTILDAEEAECNSIAAGQDCLVRVILYARAPLTSLDIAIGIYDELSRPLGLLQSSIQGGLLSVTTGESEVMCRVHRLPLFPGGYFLNASITRNNELLDGKKECARLVISSSSFYQNNRLPRYGPVLFDYAWEEV